MTTLKRRSPLWKRASDQAVPKLLLSSQQEQMTSYRCRHNAMSKCIVWSLGRSKCNSVSVSVLLICKVQTQLQCIMHLTLARVTTPFCSFAIDLHKITVLKLVKAQYLESSYSKND